MSSTVDHASPFLAGNFAPVRHEVDADGLSVIGAIPDDLDGMFLRVGPNPQFDPPGPYHWFDGDGMIHAVSLSKGRARYRNRWVRTRPWEIEREAGRALWGGLASGPQFDAPEGLLIKHTANTALAHHAGTLLALMEATPPYAVRLPSLDTVGVHDFGGALQTPFTAHPKVDPSTGEMIFFGYQFWPPFLTYGEVSPAGEITHTAEISLRGPVMMHDFAITERYAVIMDLPLVFDLARMEAGGFPLEFKPELGARFGILPRRGVDADVRWFESPSCMVFHTANAWEEGDEVVLVACRMERTDVLAGALLDDPPPSEPGRLYRWRFNLATGAVREEPLDDVASDFPRVHEGLTGSATRYVYSARFDASRRDATPWIDAVVKYDLTTGSSEAHPWGRGRYGGEAVFVPRTVARSEDDGYLMTFVWDEREQRSELVILDALDLTQRPVARVILPQRVPFGFHGMWTASDAIR
jgi:carotenoid cleavage dioxygenase-like enzyme